MKTYIIRPYNGHDCHSVTGFNDGYYLDDITVQAENEDHAKYLAMKEFIKEHDITGIDVQINGHFGDWTLYTEWGHTWYDDSGNEYAEEPEDVDTECHYLYAYIDFNDVTEGNNNEQSMS